MQFTNQHFSRWNRIRFDVEYNLRMLRRRAGLRWTLLKQSVTDWLTRHASTPAGKWTARHVGAPAAAYALLHLNRWARQAGRGNPAKEKIYNFKNTLVRHFYTSNLCVRASKQIQTLKCWYCEDGDDGWGGSCDHCDGSGVYAEYALIKFVFCVGGRYYSWHQPERLVTWPVQLEDRPAGEFKEEKGTKRVISNRALLQFFSAILGEYAIIHQL